MNTMQAYHGKPELKAAILAMLAQHRAADRIVRGRYWEDGRGCAVGCALESLRQIEGLDEIAQGDHALYERYLGVPSVLGRLEDYLFERMPNDIARAWPERFAAAIQPGADLSMALPMWLHGILSDPEGGVQQQCANRPEIKPSIEAVIALFATWITTGTKPSATEWLEAGRNAAAYAAAYAAADGADRASILRAQLLHQCDQLIAILEATR